MRTPVEDLGLSGARMARRVQRALHGLPEPELVALLGRMHVRALARRLVYWHDDEVEAIRILARPLAALPQQLSYIRYVSFTLQNALKRLPDLYLTDPAVRAALRLPDDEERWLKECWGQSQREINPVFGRLDAVVDFASPMWKDTLRFLEPNLSGIGGLHMGPACDRIIADEVFPLLARADPGLRLVPNVDLRELLMQEIVDHLEAIGRRGEHVCFVEPKYATEGPDEQEELARYLRGRYGLRMLHADPGELALWGDEVVHDGWWWTSPTATTRWPIFSSSRRREWTWSRCAACSARTVWSPPSPGSSIARAASRCSPTPCLPSATFAPRSARCSGATCHGRVSSPIDGPPSPAVGKRTCATSPGASASTWCSSPTGVMAARGCWSARRSPRPIGRPPCLTLWWTPTSAGWSRRSPWYRSSTSRSSTEAASGRNRSSW